MNLLMQILTIKIMVTYDVLVYCSEYFNYSNDLSFRMGHKFRFFRTNELR